MMNVDDLDLLKANVALYQASLMKEIKKALTHYQRASLNLDVDAEKLLGVQLLLAS